jgi:hypothetical protein
MKIKDYIINARTYLNKKAEEIGNKIYSGLGDVLTTEVSPKGLGALVLAGSLAFGSVSCATKTGSGALVGFLAGGPVGLVVGGLVGDSMDNQDKKIEQLKENNIDYDINFINKDNEEKIYISCDESEDCKIKMSKFSREKIKESKFPKNGYRVIVMAKNKYTNNSWIAYDVEANYDKETNKIITKKRI